MIICHSRRYVFNHIHKTAGESVTQALAAHLARGDLTLGTTLRGKMANWGYPRPTPLKKHSRAVSVRAHLGEDLWATYFKFAFVRHPVDRARSLYGYYGKMLRQRDRRSIRNALFALPGTSVRDPLNWPAMRAFLDTASFSEFIRHPRFNTGTRPQWRSVCDDDGEIIVDFIGRYETLQADFDRVTARIGLGAIALPRRNASRAPDDDAPVSAQDRAHLIEMYRRDFELFGYATDPVPA